MDKGTLHIEYLPLRDIRMYDKNPKLHDISRIVRSIKRFGYVSPVIIDSRSLTLVSGYGRIKALIQMREQGEAHPVNVHVKDGEWMVPAVIGNIFRSDIEAHAYIIADNRITELGGWNDVDLLENMEEIARYDRELLESIGYSEDEVDIIRKMVRVPDLSEITRELGEYSDEDLWRKITVRVPDHVYDRFESLMADAPGEKEWEKMNALLCAVDRSRLFAVDNNTRQ